MEEDQPFPILGNASGELSFAFNRYIILSSNWPYLTFDILSATVFFMFQAAEDGVGDIFLLYLKLKFSIDPVQLGGYAILVYSFLMLYFDN